MNRLLLALMFFAINAYGASEHLLKSCVNNNPTINLHIKCVSIIKNNGIFKESGSMKIYGLGDIVYIEDNGTTTVISGSSTRLTQISHLAFDNQNMRLLVFDKSGELLSFVVSASGNVAPHFFFRLPDEIKDNVVSIVPLPKHNSLLAVSSRGELFVYNLEATLHSPKEENSTKLIKRFSSYETGVDLIQSVKYDQSSEQLIVSTDNASVTFILSEFPALKRRH